MPEAHEITLTIPPELGPADVVLSDLRDRVRALELDRAADRQRTSSVLVVVCWAAAPCSRSPGTTGPRAASPGATCGPG
ncbi:MAG: hypothetical protein E6J90_53210, partial [Deltaproteobacteria bacterium]